MTNWIAVEKRVEANTASCELCRHNHRNMANKYRALRQDIYRANRDIDSDIKRHRVLVAKADLQEAQVLALQHLKEEHNA